MNKITSMLVVAIFLISGNIVMAQKAMPRGPMKGNQADKKEMRAYFQDNILPVLKIQRAELDNQITSDDKTRIEELRTELQANKTLMRESRMTMRETDGKPTVAQRKEMREMRNTMHDLMNEVEILSDKYYDEIDAALEPIKENAETWKRELRETHQNMDKPERPQGERGKKMGNRPPRDGQRGQRQNPMDRFMSPEHFLLWNPDEAMSFFEDEAAMNDKINLNLFPNPASSSVQVSVDLTEEQTLEISILNRDGQEVLPNEKTTSGAGVYTKNFNLSELDNGIYFVKVKAGTFSKVEQLIIQK